MAEAIRVGASWDWLLVVRAMSCSVNAYCSVGGCASDYA